MRRIVPWKRAPLEMVRLAFCFSPCGTIRYGEAPANQDGREIPALVYRFRCFSRMVVSIVWGMDTWVRWRYASPVVDVVPVVRDHVGFYINVRAWIGS